MQVYDLVYTSVHVHQFNKSAHSHAPAVYLHFRRLPPVCSVGAAATEVSYYLLEAVTPPKY